MREGSYIHFLNANTNEMFHERIVSAGFIREEDQPLLHIKTCIWTHNHVRVAHTEGDPARYEDLQPVVKQRVFATAILLGTTTAGYSLPPEHNDARVLSMMLALRKAFTAKYPRSSIQVVAEIDQDHSAVLALAPKSTVTLVPDFVVWLKRGWI